MRAQVNDMLRFTAVAMTAMFLAACGGGGATTVAGGGGGVVGTGKQVVVSGQVTGFGSVFVNGIEFSTAGANIFIDDIPALESNLKAGMTVKVRGTADDVTRKGTAVRIDARDALEGQIQAIDTVNNSITVMGQVVRVEDNVTRLNDNDAVKTFSAAGFAINDIVEVHGFPDDSGGLRATRVARKVSGEFESKGFITGLGTSSFSLSPTPGGASVLTVNYSIGQLPGGAVNGSRVQVKSATAPSAGTITASLIRLEEALGVSGENVLSEGIVTSGTLPNFIINGQQVITNSATLFEGGLNTDFAVGVKLEADGVVGAGGALVASKIVFRSTIKIEADVSAVSAGSLSVLGKTVGIDAYTRVDNGPVGNGSHVEVRAFVDRNGNLLASRIIVLGASSRAVLQGPVTAADATAGTLTILGTALVSDSATQWRASSTVSDSAVSRAAFYAQLKADSVVKVRWDVFTATTAPIKEAEIELGT